MCHVAVYTVVSLVISSPQREAPLGVFPVISEVSPKWSRIPPMSKSQAPPCHHQAWAPNPPDTFHLSSGTSLTFLLNRGPCLQHWPPTLKYSGDNC